MTYHEARRRHGAGDPVFVRMNSHIAQVVFLGLRAVRTSLLEKNEATEKTVTKLVKRISDGAYVEKPHNWYRLVRDSDFDIDQKPVDGIVAAAHTFLEEAGRAVSVN